MKDGVKVMFERSIDFFLKGLMKQEMTRFEAHFT